MRVLLAAEAPRDGIIGEEFGTSEGSTGRQWVLDPIDGTISFMGGRADLRNAHRAGRRRLAGDRRDRPADPGTLGRRDRSGDIVQRQAGRIAPCRDLSDAVLATSRPHYFYRRSSSSVRRFDAKVSHRIVSAATATITDSWRAGTSTWSWRRAQAPRFRRACPGRRRRGRADVRLVGRSAERGQRGRRHRRGRPGADRRYSRSAGLPRALNPVHQPQAEQQQREQGQRDVAKDQQSDRPP